MGRKLKTRKQNELNCKNTGFIDIKEPYYVGVFF